MTKPIIIANSISNKVYAVAATLIENKPNGVGITTCMLSITGFDKGDVTSQFINWTKLKFPKHAIHGQPITMEV